MACKVTTNKHSRLALRLYFDGHATWEGLGWPDSEVNRQLAQRIADQISAEIRSKTFTPERYRRYFPNGNHADKLVRHSEIIAPEAPTLDAFFAAWIEQRQPPLVRPAQSRDYRQHLTAYVLSTRVNYGAQRPRLGDLRLSDLRPAHLRELQRQLLGRGLKLKTVRNVIDGSFRAMVRDARKDDLIDTDPFAAVDWPRGGAQSAKPDPFTLEEQERIREWFWRSRRVYYVFICALFDTGMRPSEAVALRWADVDTVRGTIAISRSRYMGSEGATKTPHSERTIRILPALQTLLADLKPLRVVPEGYVFLNAKNGGPINQSEWPKDHWQAALRATGVRPRKFYSTRHTFISIALTRGVNLKWLADYAGTSVSMIEKHYGRFLADGDDHQLQLLGGPERVPSRGRLRRVGGGANPQPQQKVTGRRRKTQTE